MLLISILTVAGCATESAKVDSPVMTALRPEIKVLGQRNWVVIAEAAFPVQSRQGIKVMSVDADIPELVESVELVIEETHHVKPRIYVTTEIDQVSYDYAPGVKNYQKELKAALHEREVIRLDHEMLLQMLKTTTKDYQVLVIKSRTALPYSSVFMELGSGYWDNESESILRDTIEKKLTPVDPAVTETAETPQIP